MRSAPAGPGARTSFNETISSELLVQGNFSSTLNFHESIDTDGKGYLEKKERKRKGI